VEDVTEDADTDKRPAMTGKQVHQRWMEDENHPCCQKTSPSNSDVTSSDAAGTVMQPRTAEKRKLTKDNDNEDKGHKKPKGDKEDLMATFFLW